MKTHKLMRTAFAAGLALLLGAPLLQAQTESTNSSMGGASGAKHRGQLSEKDYKFAVKAARGGMEEVELGQLAEQKANNEAVRSFGQKMVTDHSKANDDLKQIVAQKGATLPTQLTHKEHATMEDLQKATGADFDKTYVRAMLKDHREDVKEFKEASKDLQDPELRSFAAKTLPVLEEHLKMVESMEPTIKGEK
jgi:putative membrane protein